jgi:hypothetical protein
MATANVTPLQTREWWEIYEIPEEGFLAMEADWGRQDDEWGAMYLRSLQEDAEAGEAWVGKYR